MTPLAASPAAPSLRAALEALVAERIEERADDYGRDEESWEPQLSDAERQARAALASDAAGEEEAVQQALEIERERLRRVIDDAGGLFYRASRGWTKAALLNAMRIAILEGAPAATPAPAGEGLREALQTAGPLTRDAILTSVAREWLYAELEKDAPRARPGDLAAALAEERAEAALPAQAGSGGLDVEPSPNPPERPGWIGVRLRDAFWRDDYYITGKYNHHHRDGTTVAHDYREEACRETLIEPIYPYDRNLDDRGATVAKVAAAYAAAGGEAEG